MGLEACSDSYLYNFSGPGAIGFYMKHRRFMLSAQMHDNNCILDGSPVCMIKWNIHVSSESVHRIGRFYGRSW